MKKVCFILTIIVSVILVALLLTGCVEGFVDDEQYQNLISGVTAYDEENNSYVYDNEILLNDIEFDTQIEYKKYCRLEIRKVNNCNVRGIVFVVRSLGTGTLKFTVFANDVQLYSKQKEVKSNVTTDIDLFFEPHTFLTSDSLYITVEQILEDEQEEGVLELMNYSFDGVMVAFGE